MMSGTTTDEWKTLHEDVSAHERRDPTGTMGQRAVGRSMSHLPATTIADALRHRIQRGEPGARPAIAAMIDDDPDESSLLE